MDNPFVKKLSLLTPLDRSDTEALSSLVANTEWIERHQHLFREGDRLGATFVILRGWACRYKILPSGSRQILAFLMPGDSTEHNSTLLSHMDHGIQTITSCEVAVVPQDRMDTILSAHPRILRAITLCQLIDAGTMRAWMTNMGRRTSIERVAHLMCELQLRARAVNIGDEWKLELPLSQQILADALGMTPIHLNRIFKKLRDRGAMVLKHGRLTLNDPEALVQIAGFKGAYLNQHGQSVERDAS